MPNLILTLTSVHCMYTCMLVHVYLGGLSNNDHHSNPRQNFFSPGEGWRSWALYLYMHCTQGVLDNVYLISSKCKESKSKFGEILIWRIPADVLSRIHKHAHISMRFW